MTTITPTTALVLPPAPTASLDTAISYWTPSITSAYARLRSPHLFYIGVFPPFATVSRRASFNAAQKLLTALYNLVYALTIKHEAEGVDVRIVFLSDDDSVFGPVMSLEQLADLQEWDQLLCTRNDQGYLLQGQFLAGTTSPGVRVYYIDAGTVQPGEKEGEVVAEREGSEHTVVAVGGTFDHLHLGHKLLLTCTAYMAASETDTTRIIVGITGLEMLKNKKYAEQLDSYEMRADRTLEFLRGIADVTPYDCRAPLSRTSEEGKIVATISEWKGEEDRDGAPKQLAVELCELSDPFGPTITDKDVTMLVVTKETESGGVAVNEKRKERGWGSLEVGVVDLLMDGDEKLSSTELRRKAGEATA